FLRLPNELLTKILALLPPKDRLKARVNKRLNEIEAQSKFHVKEFRIVEIPDMFRRLAFRSPQDFYFSDQNPYSCACLRRLFSNTSIESLTVTLEAEGKLGQGSLIDKVRDLIKEFKNIGNLTIQFEFFVYIMDESFFLSFVQSCDELTLLGVNQIAVEAIHTVYKIIEGSAKCRRFKCDLLMGAYYLFLSRIGIEVRGRYFYSNRDDIEVLVMVRNGRNCCSIFVGN
ncbi:hypothetical protein PMAYCL1PPCAC_01463, partial [Pristionchus mayeri]